MFSKYEYYELGSSPIDEDCVQVNSNTDYMPAMREECRRYKRQLERDFPIPEGINAHYTIKSFSHDFGSYLEVCVVYDESDEKANEFVFDVLDSNLPLHWTID